MCVAIFKPFDGRITKKRLREAYRANPDGWGIVHDGRIKYLKTVSGFNGFYEAYRNWKSDNLVIHFRTASSGNIGHEFCHPFKVNPDLYFVENGNLYHYSNYFYEKNDGKTDVQRFNDDILKKLPNNFLDNPEIRQSLEDYCKSNFTKAIFMDSGGKVDIINEQAGEWIDGCWYSNGGIKNYIGYGYSGAYYYHADDVRHKGGIITNRMFPPARRKNWTKCETCGGYFYKLQGKNCDDCQIFLKLKGYCN
jgi:hypothetical protein